MTEKSLKLEKFLPPYVEQLSGSEKGKVYELSLDKISIGRSKDNNIVIISDAISRLHANISKKDNYWIVEDLGSKNGVYVNGKKVTNVQLKNGDIIQIGDVLFRFNDPSGNALLVEEIHPPSDYKQFNIKRFKAKKLNLRTIILVVILIVGLVYLFSGNDEGEVDAKSEANKITSEHVFNKFKELFINERRVLEPSPGMEDPIDKAKKNMESLDWSNIELIEAEKEYKKGKRELEAENYHRAIEHFKTALTLFKGHSLAELYLKISYYRAEMAARKNWELGRQYFDSLHYQRAMFHFSQVVDLMVHRSHDKIVEEAMKYIEICKKELKAAELFP